MLKKYLLYRSTKEAPSYNVIGETFNQKHVLERSRSGTIQIKAIALLGNRKKGLFISDRWIKKSFSPSRSVSSVIFNTFNLQ